MKKFIAALLLSAITSACASSANLPVLAAKAGSEIYRLGPGDQLKITVYGEEQLTGTYVVNGRGQLAFPLLGEVPAADQTLSELELSLTSALQQGFLNSPRITVEVANYRPYYILGEVNKPGEFPFVDGLTVFSAVARAGGFTYRASQKRIFIRHRASGEEQLYRLEGQTPVQPGDTIRVAERTF